MAVSTDGQLGVPDDVQQLGWWAGGASPGADAGNIVIDGHVDSATQGTGALFRLSHTPVGANVTLDTRSGTLTYTVIGRREFAKSQLPADVFSTTGPARLVLITCGGSFARGHYSDNVVVYATRQH